MNQIRQEEIHQLIQHRGLISIRELRELYPEISLMTLHRDLDKLESAGHIIKIRGGARSVSHKSEPVYEERIRENPEAKNSIAKKALSLIKPGNSYFFDSGTTMLALARELPDINITIFTTAPNIAVELRHLSLPSINLCCGNLNRTTLSLSGNNTLKMLDDINIDLAFIGVSGCSLEVGFTCGQEAEMLVKQKVIEKARTSVAVFDHGKLNKLMPYTFALIGDVNYIISDRALPAAFAEKALEENVIIL